MSFALKLAWQFRKNKTGGGLLSFISMSSILGVGLGCFVLIVLLSVMNGFERELRDKVLSQIPHGELIAVDERGIQQWQTAINTLKQKPHVVSVQPRVHVVAMAQRGRSAQAIELNGINTQYLDPMDRRVTSPESWQLFESEKRAILMTPHLLKKLNVSVGDEIQILVPRAANNQQFRSPKAIRFTVVATLNSGTAINNTAALVHGDYIESQVEGKAQAQRLQIRLDDPYMAPEVIRTIGYDFDQYVYISDWTRSQGHLYNDIQLVRIVIFIALMLLIAVACFNIVSTLFMAVNEKQSAIAVLKTMGATDQLVMRVFVYHGVINGAFGAIVGSVLGGVFAIYGPEIAVTLESMTGNKLIAGDVYFIDFLPSELHWQDVLLTLSSALLLCFLATLYPARKAASLSPAQVLTH